MFLSSVLVCYQKHQALASLFFNCAATSFSHFSDRREPPSRALLHPGVSVEQAGITGLFPCPAASTAAQISILEQLSALWLYHNSHKLQRSCLGSPAPSRLLGEEHKFMGSPAQHSPHPSAPSTRKQLRADPQGKPNPSTFPKSEYLIP